MRALMASDVSGDLARCEVGDVALRGCGAAQVIEVQVTVRHFGLDLRLVEAAAEAVDGPGAPLAARQDRGRPVRYVGQHRFALNKTSTASF